MSTGYPGNEILFLDHAAKSARSVAAAWGRTTRQAIDLGLALDARRAGRMAGRMAADALRHEAARRALISGTKPRPVLADHALYLGDNGRLLCGLCSGSSARFTGRDLSGARVERVTAAIAAEAEAMGFKLRCEACGKEPQAARDEPLD